MNSLYGPPRARLIRLVLIATTVAAVLAQNLILVGGAAATDQTAPAAGPCAQIGGETVATDKADYAPEEIVHISGGGYAADCDVVVQVTRPDGSIVLGDGSFSPGSDTVSTDGAGAFAYDYQLDGIEGTYQIDVIGADSAVLAHATFTDAIPAALGLFSDAARSIAKVVFERGDTVYARLGPVTSPDVTNKYKYNLLKPGGVGYGAPYPTACLTPNGSGNLDDSHVLAQATDPLSDTARWTYRLTTFATVGCSSTTVNRDAVFFVLQAYAFTSSVSRNACLSDATCGSPTPRPVVTAGSTVYLQVRGFTANRAGIGLRFIRPDASVACAIGPVTATAAGIVSFDYPSGACPAIGNVASDIGNWTIDASPENFAVASFGTNLDGFTVAGIPTTTTEVRDGTNAAVTSAVLGTAIHDHATVSAPNGTPTGTVNFKRWTENNCGVTSGNLVSIEPLVALTAGQADSTATSSLAPGDYSYRVSFQSGDTSQWTNGSPSDCEPFTITQATPGVSTIVKDGSGTTVDNANPAALGTQVHDTATLTGQVGTFSFDGTATVTYAFFTNGTCETPAAGTENVTVAANGTVPDSSASAALGAGSYAYQATYNGNTNYATKTGDCEPFTVNTGTASVTTETHRETQADSHVVVPNPSAIPLGSTVHDKATVTGVTGIDPTGTVTFTLYRTALGDPAQNCAGPIYAGPETVAVGTESSSVGPLPTGRYGYKAVYNGDTNYVSGTGAACEIFEIGKADTTVATEVHDINHNPATSFPFAAIVHDKAIVGGQVSTITVTGTVTYRFFDKTNPTASTCEGSYSSETVAVGTESSPHGPLTNGSYAFQAVYNGDANYKSSTSDCEPFVVTNECPTIGNFDVNGDPQLNRDINSYVLFAYKSLTWKGGSLLNSGNWGHINGGNAGVNRAAPNSSTFVLNFGTSARGIMSPGSQLVGDTVRADDAQDIIYYLFANTLNPSFGATVNNPNLLTPKGNYPFSPPVLASEPGLPFFAYSTQAAFASNLPLGFVYVPLTVVPAGGSFTAAPNTWYGTIDARDGSTLNFGPGTYRVWDFTAIGKKVTFNVTDSTILNVDVHLNPNDDFKFGVGTNAGAHLNIGAATSTYANSNARVTTWSNRAEIHAQYFAPTGWLDVGSLTRMYGRFWAQTITGDPNDNVDCQAG